MPQQETYLERTVGKKQIRVLKTYDRSLARETFERMQPEALQFLGRFLDVDTEGLQSAASDSRDVEEELWQEVEDGAREEWNTFSYFVVIEEADDVSATLYVSADWPSAEAFAKQIS
jgi:hypothetical protein